MIILALLLLNIVSIIFGTVAHCDRMDYLGSIYRKIKYRVKPVGSFQIRCIELGKRASAYVKDEGIEEFYEVAEEAVKLAKQFEDLMPEGTAQRCQEAIEALVDAFNKDLEHYLHWWGLYDNDRICKKTFVKITGTILADLRQIRRSMDKLIMALENSVACRVANGTLLNSSKGDCLDRYLDILREGKDVQILDTATEGRTNAESVQNG